VLGKLPIPLSVNNIMKKYSHEKIFKQLFYQFFIKNICLLKIYFSTLFSKLTETLYERLIKNWK